MSTNRLATRPTSGPGVLAAGLATVLVACGGAPSTAGPQALPGESVAIQSGDGGAGTFDAGDGGTSLQVCGSSPVAPLPYPGAVDCSTFDPTSDQWPQATALIAWALSQAKDAQGQSALFSSYTQYSEGMSCFTGSTQGQWSFVTYFVTPTLALTQDVTLPMVDTGTCGCSMLTFPAGTLVSTMLAQLTGTPYEFRTGGQPDCAPPDGTTEYTGEPCTGGSCGFAW